MQQSSWRCQRTNYEILKLIKVPIDAVMWDRVARTVSKWAWRAKWLNWEPSLYVAIHFHTGIQHLAPEPTRWEEIWCAVLLGPVVQHVFKHETFLTLSWLILNGVESLHGKWRKWHMNDFNDGCRTKISELRWCEWSGWPSLMHLIRVMYRQCQYVALELLPIQRTTNWGTAGSRLPI